MTTEREHYYFLLKGDRKLGPYKLSDLKAQTLYFDELIWRSDSDEWKKALDFDELNDIVVVKPPLTPLEQKTQDFNNRFATKSLPRIIGIYIVITTVLSVTSFGIAINEWDKIRNRYLMNKDDVGKDSYQVAMQNVNRDTEKLKSLRRSLLDLKEYVNPTKVSPNTLQYNRDAHRDSIYKFENLQNQITLLEIDSSYQETRISFQQTGRLPNKIAPIYDIPQSIILSEDAYALGQGFLFRSFRGYFSRIYLRMQEQEDYKKLFWNLTFSSCLSVLILFLVLTPAYYLIQRQRVIMTVDK